MNGFTFSWLAGMGIIGYRSVARQHGPPWPGQMLMASVVFVVLAAVSEAGPGAKTLATIFGWGLNAAAFLDLYPKGSTNQVVQASMPGGNADPSWWGHITSSKIPTSNILPGKAGAAQSTAKITDNSPVTPSKIGASMSSNPPADGLGGVGGIGGYGM